MKDRFTLVLGFGLLLYCIVSLVVSPHLLSLSHLLSSHFFSSLISSHLFTSLDWNSELFCLLYFSCLISSQPFSFHLFFSSHLHSFSVVISSQHFSVLLLSSLLVCICLIWILLIFGSSHLNSSLFISSQLFSFSLIFSLFISFHLSPFLYFISSWLFSFFSSHVLLIVASLHFIYILFNLDSPLIFTFVLNFHLFSTLLCSSLLMSSSRLFLTVFVLNLDPSHFCLITSQLFTFHLISTLLLLSYLIFSLFV